MDVKIILIIILMIPLYVWLTIVMYIIHKVHAKYAFLHTMLATVFVYIKVLALVLIILHHNVLNVEVLIF